MNILVVQNRMGMGDLVIFMPFIEAISKKYKVPITCLVKKNSKADEIFKGKKQRLITVSRYDKRKNHEKVIMAIKNLKQIRGQNNSFNCEFLINCAGLFSDEIARMDGMSPNVRIIPFRGEYYKIRDTKNSILNNMIYPLADPDLPFLGIHLTKTANGEIEAGPNAVLAFSKEGYKWTDINLVDLTKVLTYPGMIKLGKKYLKTGLSEMYRSLNKKVFVKEIQKLINGISSDDIIQIPSGVRAQAVDQDGNLLDDFLFEEGNSSLHVLNSPSPAATASLAIGESIASKILN